MLVKAAEKLVETLVGSITSPLHKKISNSHISKAIQKADLTPYINSLAHTKTLYSSDNPVLIDEFYCEPRICLTANHSYISLDKYLEVIEEKNSLLFGQMGQGKSIFLKQLTLTLINQNKIALFYELKFFKENDDLIENLIELLRNITHEDGITREIFFKLAETGKLYLILDGYDEISSVATVKFTEDLKKLDFFPKIHIILSSRPAYYANYVSHNFYSFELDSYKFNDQVQLITKLITQKNRNKLNFDLKENQAEIDEIVSQIQTSEIAIQDLLKTPLMVLLFIMRLQSKYTPAKNLKEFFTDLFQVAFIRHDITKNNFKRERKSALGDTELLEIFKILCFDTKNSSEFIFDEQRCLYFIQEALEELNLTERANAIDVFKEFTQVICFIIDLGSNSYGFIHRSIQDFYAALFISEQDSKAKKYFYSRMLEDKYKEFYACIFFLKEIDEYAFIENIEYPVLREMLDRFYQSSSIHFEDRLADVFKEHFSIGRWYAFQLRNVDNIDISVWESRLAHLEHYLSHQNKVSKRRFTDYVELDFDDMAL